MKYTIEGFNQEEILRIGNLDVTDLVILRWIVDFEPKMAKKIIDDEIYFWVNYQSLLEALPILSISKQTLYRKLKKMCDLEILKHQTIRDDSGTFSYYSFGDKFINLVMSKMIDPVSEMIDPYVENDKGGISEMIEHNNSSIKEINLLNNSKENNNKLNSLLLKENDKKTKFVKPTLEKVREYCLERNNTIDAEQFIDYYNANGWKVGRNPMKDWKATIRTWERNKKSNFSKKESDNVFFEIGKEEGIF